MVGTGTPASCTEAVFDAALLTGGTIRFDCGPSPKVIVVSAPKAVTRDTSLEGEDLIVLSGDDKVGIIRVGPGVSFGLHHMTLTAGNGGPEGGGALFNDGGSLTVNTSTVSDNSAVQGSGSGGGVFNNAGTLTVRNSTFGQNSAARAGGAVETAGGNVVLFGVRLENNTTGATPGNGGGLHAGGPATVNVARSVVSGNSASLEGGGLGNLGDVAKGLGGVFKRS